MAYAPLGDDCILNIGSMTAALRARQLIQHSAIRCEVIKSEERSSRRGCVYAVVFPCYHKNNVQRILVEGGIRIPGGRQR